jgi:hypothetical protein
LNAETTDAATATEHQETAATPATATEKGLKDG